LPHHISVKRAELSDPGAPSSSRLVDDEGAAFYAVQRICQPI